MLSSGQ